MRSNQDVFNQVYLGLAQQQEVAVNNIGSCRYRSATGDKCAIGQLIPDALYSPALEGCSITAVLYEFDDLSLLQRGAWSQLLPVLDIDLEFARSMQLAHDATAGIGMATAATVLASMRAFAGNTGLTVPLLPALGEGPSDTTITP